MIELCILPMALQGLAMVADEAWFHRRRDLPRWERIGHPLDTLTIAACLIWLLLGGGLAVYVVLAIASTLFVTKDEAVHTRLCGTGEHWLHALLFALHPIVLAAFAVLAWAGHTEILVVQLVLVLAFFAYQVIYWNVVRAPRAATTINNDWYEDLGARWYEAKDTPIALLRAEARQRNPWIAGELVRRFGPEPCSVLDLGCGAGLLANDLAARGHRVDGVDTTAEALEVARAHDPTGTVRYHVGDAYELPFDDASFDAVCAMDLLEHVEQPERVIAEAARVLAPGGLLFFHTFNRTWLAHLIVIKGVELFVRNTPRDLHVIRLFLRPDDVKAMCRAHDMEPLVLEGSRPRFGWPLWRMVLTGEVGDDFEFTFTRSLRLGYTGYARKARA